jgi:hypothetical protein
MEQTQIESLRTMIYNLLISNPDVGMGEMGECRETADELVDEWINLNNINITQ